ncbi:hypothetical protein Daus18300_007277 [Diaporthe australafricana]|uniref:Uncharacterized protein n=1 Tax=Diaporthe australafricana TaxID=127596 RepID=A0ABR3WNS6_9PEZI
MLVILILISTVEGSGVDIDTQLQYVNTPWLSLGKDDPLCAALCWLTQVLPPQAAHEQIIKNLQRENAMISTAWYDLTSRLQSNHVVLQRKDQPKSWLNKQRQMVNGKRPPSPPQVTVVHGNLAGGLRARLTSSPAGDVWALAAALAWSALGDYYQQVRLRVKRNASPPPLMRPRANGTTALISFLTPFSFRLFSLRIIVTTSTAQDHQMTSTAGSKSGRGGGGGRENGNGGRGIFSEAFLLLYSIAWRSLDNSWVVRKLREIILKSILMGTGGRGAEAARPEKGNQYGVFKTRGGFAEL